MCSRANDNRGKRFFSHTIFSPFDYFLFSEVINGSGGNFEPRLSGLIYLLVVDWSGALDLELSIIKRSLWSVVSVLNQEYDCSCLFSCFLFFWGFFLGGRMLSRIAHVEFFFEIARVHVSSLKWRISWSLPLFISTFSVPTLSFLLATSLSYKNPNENVQNCTWNCLLS